VQKIPHLQSLLLKAIFHNTSGCLHYELLFSVSKLWDVTWNLLAEDMKIPKTLIEAMKSIVPLPQSKPPYARFPGKE
jgi:hypothetical protein